jgi:hypothetical protein
VNGCPSRHDEIMGVVWEERKACDPLKGEAGVAAQKQLTDRKHRDPSLYNRIGTAPNTGLWDHPG